jgi:hypothetical protein
LNPSSGLTERTRIIVIFLSLIPTDQSWWAARQLARVANEMMRPKKRLISGIAHSASVGYFTTI